MSYLAAGLCLIAASNAAAQVRVVPRASAAIPAASAAVSAAPAATPSFAAAAAPFAVSAKTAAMATESGGPALLEDRSLTPINDRGTLERMIAIQGGSVTEAKEARLNAFFDGLEREGQIESYSLRRDGEQLQIDVRGRRWQTHLAADDFRRLTGLQQTEVRGMATGSGLRGGKRRVAVLRDGTDIMGAKHVRQIVIEGAGRSSIEAFAKLLRERVDRIAGELPDAISIYWTADRQNQLQLWVSGQPAVVDRLSAEALRELGLPARTGR